MQHCYERIYKSYLKLKYPNGVLKDAISFAETRQAIKSLHMRCYFDYEGRIGPNTRRAMGSCKNKDDVDAEIDALQEQKLNNLEMYNFGGFEDTEEEEEV